MRNGSLQRRRFDVQKLASNLARNWALWVPAIRRLYESRNAIVVERHSLIARLEVSASPQAASPFFHYNASFDPIEVMRRHAASGLQARKGYVTNFLGVVIDPKVFPSFLTGLAGQIEQIPIPADWHSDIAEWGAALRAVDLARDTFTMIELGCGWGCWMNSTGIAARRKGVHVHLIGAIPNGLTVEYMPWLVRLFEDVPRPQKGELTMPTVPGLGLKFDQAALQRFGVA